MGIVHAKEPSFKNSAPTVDLVGVKAKVQRINVEGLGRTKDDVVIDSVKNVFTADNFQMAVFQIQEARVNLEKLGCFKNVNVLIDTYNGAGAEEDGIEVTFGVMESNLIGANVQTDVGNNEGSVSTGALLRNVFGRGEQINASYTYGSNKKTSFHTMAKKPLHNKAEAQLTAEVYQNYSETPRCSYKQADRGMQFGLNFSTLPKLNHKVSFDNTWRHLTCLSALTPFFVREESGHSLKSSVIHEVKVDTREKFIFPEDGVYAKLKTELAGLTGGNIRFAKNELEIEVNMPLVRGLAIQGNLQLGHLFNLKSNIQHRICDRFLLGGPSSIRGFEMAGVGPHEQGIALGGEMYWVSCLHIFTHMPLLERGGFTERFRIHAFVNMGSNGNFHKTGNIKKDLQTLSREMRLSYGTGLAMDLAGIARLELNYCIPLLLQRGDRPSQGLQFGIASNFL